MTAVITLVPLKRAGFPSLQRSKPFPFGSVTQSTFTFCEVEEYAYMYSIDILIEEAAELEHKLLVRKNWQIKRKTVKFRM